MNIFLSGDSGSGKSTLLLDFLSQSDLEAAGYTTVHLLDQEGRRVAHQLRDLHLLIHELRQNLQKDNGFDAWLFAQDSADSADTAVSADIDAPCFCRLEEEKMVFFTRLFVEKSLALLSQYPGSDLLVLDEVGGPELLEDDFYAKLLDMLDSRQALLIVWKNAAGLAHMKLENSLYEALLERRSRLLDRADQHLICEKNEKTRRQLMVTLKNYFKRDKSFDKESSCR